jgi:hypothetical protein
MGFLTSCLLQSQDNPFGVRGAESVSGPGSCLSTSVPVTVPLMCHTYGEGSAPQPATQFTLLHCFNTYFKIHLSIIHPYVHLPTCHLPCSVHNEILFLFLSLPSDLHVQSIINYTAGWCSSNTLDWKVIQSMYPSGYLLSLLRLFYFSPDHYWEIP